MEAISGLKIYLVSLLFFWEGVEFSGFYACLSRHTHAHGIKMKLGIAQAEMRSYTPMKAEVRKTLKWARNSKVKNGQPKTLVPRSPELSSSSM